jgi:hypothetical protein
VSSSRGGHFTDDQKDDWIWREKGRTLGPNPLLRREFADVTGEMLYVYSTSNFFRVSATKLMGREADPLVMQELSRYDELASADRLDQEKVTEDLNREAYRAFLESVKERDSDSSTDAVASDRSLAEA